MPPGPMPTSSGPGASAAGLGPKGARKQMTTTTKCRRCAGTGSVMVDGMNAPMQCPPCKGTGSVQVAAVVPSRVEVSTREYEFSHGKAPRGFGSWAFFFDDRSMRVEDAFWVNQSTFADARRAARVEAARRGCDTVFVGS